MQVEVELATLRREVSELRIGLQNLEARQREPHKESDESDAYWEPLQSRMKAEMERDNKSAMVGVLRSAVFLQGPSGNNVYGSENQFGDVAKLPPVEQVIALGAALSNPIGLRAMYLIFKRIYEGQQMTMTKSEIATALSIAEPDVEQALLPLIANGTLRWGKSSDGSDYYQLERPDLFATLLTLV
jgi:hypothetical protein